LQLTAVTIAASGEDGDGAVCTAYFVVVTVHDGGDAIITPTATPR